MSNRKEGVEW